jgi:hypothetical protein
MITGHHKTETGSHSANYACSLGAFIQAFESSALQIPQPFGRHRHLSDTLKVGAAVPGAPPEKLPALKL